MTEPSSQKGSIPSQAYEAQYYQAACDGYKEFSESQGRSLPLRLQIPLALAQIKPGMCIVDIGCGRGEIVYQAVQSGAMACGLDYSEEAVKIARNTLHENLERDKLPNYLIGQCDATLLPFTNGSIDRIFMLDVVEHLTPVQLSATLNEVYRALKPDGYLVVHTMPSLWYYRYGYPVFRLIQSLRGIKLPRDPRDRYEYSFLHINEQTPLSLRKTIAESRLKGKVWLQTTQDYAAEKNRFFRMVMYILVKVYPFRWIFCDDIFAIGKKNR